MKRIYRVAEYAIVTVKTRDTGWKDAKHSPVYETSYNVWEERDIQSNLIRTARYSTGKASIKAAQDEYTKAITDDMYLPF